MIRGLWNPASARLQTTLQLPVTRRFVLGSAIAWLIVHLAIWIVVAIVEGLQWTAMLDNWDAGWYSKIVVRGYFWPAWAFYPLYPLLVKGASQLLFLAPYPQVAGSIVSTLLFFVFCRWLTREEELAGLAPSTRAGWLFFLLSPASFVFHSHHTESLFLVLMLASFVFSMRERRRPRWVLAAIAAGLAALTRPQGIFLAITTAVASAARVPTWPERAMRFVFSGLISAALFACYPLYQWRAGGSAWLSQSSQLHWRPEMTAQSFFRTLWLGNAWQNTDLGSLERHAAFFLLIVVTVLLWREGRRVFAAFVGLCVAVMPASGEFVGLFRYGSVLFPALFLAGDKIGRLPRMLLVVIAIFWLYLNLSLTRRFVIFRWCY